MVTGQQNKEASKMLKIVGLTDEITSCECCGKSNLKCTVALEDTTFGGITFYGRDCAAKATNRRHWTAKRMENYARNATYYFSKEGPENKKKLQNALKQRTA
jgi:ABC-type oligopeptide transport system ATPase subunit